MVNVLPAKQQEFLPEKEKEKEIASWFVAALPLIMIVTPMTQQ